MDLLVSGAPSSGTGVVRRIAQDLGVRSGDAVRFNDSWLNELGGSWLAPPRTNEMTWHSIDRDLLSDSGGSLDLAGDPAGPVVIADPRLSLLLPLWDHLAQRNLPLILVIRDPREVAAALGARNGLSARTSLALWLTYVRQALLASHARHLLVIDRGRLVKFPDTSLAAVTTFMSESLGIKAEIPGIDFSAQLVSLDAGEKRTSGIGGLTVSELGFLMDVYFQVSGTHGQVKAMPSVPQCPEWVEDVLDERLAARTREIGAESGAIAGLLRKQIAGLEAERLAYLGHVGKLESEVAQMFAERVALDQSVEQLEGRLRDCQEKADRLALSHIQSNTGAVGGSIPSGEVQLDGHLAGIKAVLLQGLTMIDNLSHEDGTGE